jgi:ankyrin repeat protein
MRYDSKMLKSVLGLCFFVCAMTAQTGAKVDFAKEILPLFRQNCVTCHGPAVQQAGLRLDRKSSALKPFSRRISAGSSENSVLYHRISGTEYGPQMPPTGAMRAEQIALVKNWIEQGADWPDSLANEIDLPPFHPKAVSMVESLRTNDLASFMKAATAEPSLLNARGPEGSTPFMYAVLYSNAATVAKLLKLGADPNKRNDARATALMWAARDFEKTKLLVENGAEVNAKSEDLRTPLMIASRKVGGAAIVKFLLDHKANPNPNAMPAAESSPLLEALTAGDAAMVEMLIQHGADAKATADLGITMAVTTYCAKCLELILPKITAKEAYTAALQSIAVLGDLKATRLMLDHGADVNAFDPLGRTPLMYAVLSDVLPMDVVQLLIDRGADVNAKDRHKNSGDAGITVLDIAKRNGNEAMIQLLTKAGAKTTPEVQVALKPRRNNTIQNAVQDSLPLLQRSDATFSAKAGCISCHNNSMSAMALGLARTRGFGIDEKSAAAQVRTNVVSLELKRDFMHQGFGNAVEDNFFDWIWSYMLLGLHAEHYPADLNTDAVVMYLMSRQTPSGDWPYPHADQRPPLCLLYTGQTALAMRAIQLYAPKPVQAAADKSVRQAAQWLAKAKAYNNEDRVWRLNGLAWAGFDKAATQAAIKELVAAQRADGGWSDLPSMNSSAYSTGESLVALRNAGMAASDAVYARGVKYLLDTQQEDGSWYVKTRALGFQPGFDAGFPHGADQFTSAAGTSWAAMALSLALPESGAVRASRER